MRPRYYLLALTIATVVSFTMVWGWVAAMPLAYLDPEYAFWRAKQDLLASCDLGEVLILGDSRAAAGIIPAQLPMRGTNMAVGGGKPVEAVAVLQRALACPDKPRLVVLSFDASHFMQPDLFWERTVRYGLLDASDLRDLARISAETADWSVFDARRTDGLPPRIRIALYTMRIPSLYFGNLLKGGVILRWWSNADRYADGIAARGQYFFGTDPGSSAIAHEGGLGRFAAAPVLDWYFDRLLALLAERQIPAVFVALPVNEATIRAVPAAMVDEFRRYLDGYALRYPGFRVSGDPMPSWPDHWFGDAFSHLNPAGAERFSAALGPRLLEPNAPAREALLQATPPDASTPPLPPPHPAPSAPTLSHAETHAQRP